MSTPPTPSPLRHVRGSCAIRTRIASQSLAGRVRSGHPAGGGAGWGRPGFAYRALLLVASAVVTVPVLLVAALSPWSWTTQETAPLMHRVARGDFSHEVTERGDVESASNVEIRCEVQSQNSAGTTILEIVPEGTYVQPGQVLVKLDSSLLENDRTKQQVVVANSQAALIQAQNDLDTAQIAKQEYLQGQYKLEELTIQIETFVAKEDYRRAEEYLKYSKGLADKGYITQAQLEGERFALDKARKELEAAETRLEVLQKFTLDKMVKQLDADIKTAEAKLNSQEHSHRLETDKLKLIDEQIAKCIIKAPEAGQVVYANNYNVHGGNEVVIEEGVQVRERQVIIRLPDPKRMQVKAKINEGKVALVKAGMPVRIRLDAFQGTKLSGTVQKVSEYPAPTSWYNSNVKDYETIVRIDSPPAGLRPGLTAEVTILVNRLSGVLEVPVQAVVEHGGKHYAILPDGSAWKPQEVELGPTNDKFVVIRKGLSEGQDVVLNAAAYRGKVGLPETPPGEPPTQLAGDMQPAADPGTKPAAQPAQPAPAAIAERMFKEMDANGNGLLEESEWPADMRVPFATADAGGDGSVDRGELMAALTRPTSRAQMAPRGGGGT